ncbi:MAG: hypothetical protein KatS3mg059_0807 [Thermomicrobiales bacterium]|nr:MAG: hypothetical protein KatS3mg059_0807 [Thermomicrobiales bacterium]
MPSGLRIRRPLRVQRPWLRLPASRNDGSGLDASRLTAGEQTGTETYTYQLLAAWARLTIPDRIRLYLNAPSPPPDLPPVGGCGVPAFPRLWTHVRLSWEMQRRPPAVLFVPAPCDPIASPAIGGDDP